MNYSLLFTGLVKTHNSLFITKIQTLVERKFSRRPNLITLFYLIIRLRK